MKFVRCSKMLLILLAGLCLMQPSPVHSQGCALPNATMVNDLLRSALVALSHEGATMTTTTTLLQHHFTCQAVASQDTYRSVSVAVTYSIDSDTTSKTLQLQLACSSGNWDNTGAGDVLEATPPANVFSIPTRRDCRTCYSGSPLLTNDDLEANCVLCSEECRSLGGLGGCTNTAGDDCCPFFNNINGSCSENHICNHDNPCQNNGTCVAGTLTNEYNCSCDASTCPTGYQVNTTDCTCFPSHTCLVNDPCLNNGTCMIMNDTAYECACPTDYTGAVCESCATSCPTGHQVNITDCTCFPSHTCLVNDPCLNNGTCVIVNDTAYECTCPTGYTGPHCNCSTCSAGYKLDPVNCSCIAVHRCVMSSQPCQNGGTCEIIDSMELVSGSALGSDIDYQCNCTENYTGANCESMVISYEPSPSPDLIISSIPSLNQSMRTSLGSSPSSDLSPSPGYSSSPSPSPHYGLGTDSGSGLDLGPGSGEDIDEHSSQPPTPPTSPVDTALPSPPQESVLPTPSPSLPTEDPMVWPWIVIGAIVAALMVFATCSGILGFIHYNRRKRKLKQKAVGHYEETKPLWEYEVLPEPGMELAQQHPPPPKETRQFSYSRSTTFTTPTNQHLSKLSSPITAPRLRHLLRNIPELHKEFSRIPSNMTTMNEVPIGAEDKNRYRDVLPNPQSRVNLFLRYGIPNSDYINASYIRDLYGHPKAFIATQGPLKETVNDYWRMVWEQKSSMIVMLTRLQETGKEKCFLYWPDPDLTKVYGDFEITTRKQTEDDNFVFTVFLLRHLKHHVTREIQHYWFTGWPDRGVPADTEPFIDFILKTREGVKNREMPGPVVVHCSSGISRSGVFIGADTAMRVLEKKNKVDLMKIVSTMRMDRGGMVQTKEQYVFLHKVLYDALLAKTKSSQNTALITPLNFLEDDDFEERLI